MAVTTASVTIQKVLKNGPSAPISVQFTNGYNLEYGNTAEMQGDVDQFIGDPHFMMKLAIALALAKGITNPAQIEGKTLTLDLTKPLTQLLQAS